MLEKRKKKRPVVVVYVCTLSVVDLETGRFLGWASQISFRILPIRDLSQNKEKEKEKKMMIPD